MADLIFWKTEGEKKMLYSDGEKSECYGEYNNALALYGMCFVDEEYFTERMNEAAEFLSRTRIMGFMR
jgi:hypothetical protein